MHSANNTRHFPYFCFQPAGEKPWKPSCIWEKTSYTLNEHELASLSFCTWQCHTMNSTLIVRYTDPANQSSEFLLNHSFFYQCIHYPLPTVSKRSKRTSRWISKIDQRKPDKSMQWSETCKASKLQQPWVGCSERPQPKAVRLLDILQCHSSSRAVGARILGQEEGRTTLQGRRSQPFLDFELELLCFLKIKWQSWDYLEPRAVLVTYIMRTGSVVWHGSDHQQLQSSDFTALKWWWFNQMILWNKKSHSLIWQILVSGQ